MKSQNITDRVSSFDSVRFEKSAKLLAELSKTETTTASDGREIEYAVYTHAQFNDWIEKNGGMRDGDLIRPKTSEDWPKLQRLSLFKAFDQEGDAFRVPSIVLGAEEKCVLRSQTFGRLIPMDKKMILLHIAAGFNYAVFNWRDEISAKGFVDDAETIYGQVRNLGFRANDIISMSYCRATFIASELKKRHHEEGMDAVFVRSPPLFGL